MMKNGIKLIDTTIGKFNTIISKLNEGVKLCEREKSLNEAEISELSKKSKELSSKIEVASTFSQNLKGLLTDSKSPPTKPE